MMNSSTITKKSITIINMPRNLQPKTISTIKRRSTMGKKADTDRRKIRRLREISRMRQT
jgi:hypothetical protein